ncbi:hypothetical protein [Persicitalea sp.]|uniref:hypothetical protein n=1 Tax=Persicitalea sp. TaxID=3100273 RepID=UPI00359316C8
MNTFEPWVAYPPLTQVRLSAIATILRDVRQKTADKHEAEDGDSEWSLGCRIYSRSCFAIRQAAANCDWLTILPEKEGLPTTEEAEKEAEKETRNRDVNSQ